MQQTEMFHWKFFYCFDLHFVSCSTTIVNTTAAFRFGSTFNILFEIYLIDYFNMTFAMQTADCATFWYELVLTPDQ